MQLWQIVMGRVLLADESELKVVTGIDDHSRFCVSAKLVARATARPVCEALAEAMRRHGVPEQILTDNGKVFTGRFGRGTGEVLFDRVCRENGIRHLLTAPHSPTTTGKVERFHKTLRAEFFADKVFTSLEDRSQPVRRVPELDKERRADLLGPVTGRSYTVLVTLADVPVWLAAVVTLAAFVASILRRRADRRERREREKAAERAEAGKVSVWPDRVDGHWCVLVKNGGDLPVHNALVSFGDEHTQSGLSHHWLGLLPPGEKRVWDLEEWNALPVECIAQPSADLRFTDAAGRHWFRDEHGRLEPREYEAIDPGDEGNWDKLKARGEDRLLPRDVADFFR